MDSSKNKSLSRSKTTTLSIASVLAKEGVSNLIPGGALLFDAAKVLFDHGRKYIADRNEERIAKFHRLLVEGPEDEDEIRNLLESEFEASDYHAILASCVQDMEDEKTVQYALLMQSFICRAAQLETRKLFIQAAKTLSMFDLTFLREIFIKGRYELMTAGGATQQLKELLQTSDPMKQISLSRLAYLGFVNEDKTEITDLARDFVQRTFEGKELLPEAIGRKPLTGIMIAIVCFEIGKDDHSRFYRPLQNALWNRQIKSSTHILDSKRSNPALFYSGGILLVGDKPITGTFLEGVEKFAERRPMVRLDISEVGEHVEFENIEFLERYSLVNCSQGNEVNEIELIVSQMFA